MYKQYGQYKQYETELSVQILFYYFFLNIVCKVTVHGGGEEELCAGGWVGVNVQALGERGCVQVCGGEWVGVNVQSMWGQRKKGFSVLGGGFSILTA